MRQPCLMAMDHSKYLDCVRQELLAALCICDSPCRHVDGYAKPEIEIQDSPELVSPSVIVRRTQHEQCLIEPSYNSVRVSIKVCAVACQLAQAQLTPGQLCLALIPTA